MASVRSIQAFTRDLILLITSVQFSKKSLASPDLMLAPVADECGYLDVSRKFSSQTRPTAAMWVRDPVILLARVESVVPAAGCNP